MWLDISHLRYHFHSKYMLYPVQDADDDALVHWFLTRSDMDMSLHCFDIKRTETDDGMDTIRAQINNIEDLARKYEQTCLKQNMHGKPEVIHETATPGYAAAVTCVLPGRIYDCIETKTARPGADLCYCIHATIDFRDYTASELTGLLRAAGRNITDILQEHGFTNQDIIIGDNLDLSSPQWAIIAPTVALWTAGALNKARSISQERAEILMQRILQNTN